MSRVVAPGPALAAALGVALTGLLGCAPEISPLWQINGVRDLASQIAVTQRGPLGQPLPDDPARPLHQALPLDRVQCRPFIVDTDGPIPTENLEFQWVACDRIECTEALLDYDELPDCDGTLELLNGGVACAAGTGPTASLTLGAPDIELGDASISDFLPSAAIVGIGSVAGAPGAAECQQRLAAREPLGDCSILHQNVAVGPISDYIAYARQQGLVVDTTDIPESLLLRPRNHTPGVEQFEVFGLEAAPGPVVVEAGGTIRAKPGATLTIRYLPDDLDLEAFEVIAADGTPLVGEDFFQGRWFATGDHPSFETLPQISEVTLTLGGFEETSFLYFLVTDTLGSANMGWLQLEARTDP